MGLLTRHRLGNVAIDVVLLFVAWYASFFLRFDVISPYWAHLRDAGSWRFVAVQVVVLIAMRVYLRQWRYTSLRDVLALGQALLVGVILAYGSMWLLPPIDRGGNDPLPRGVVVLDLVLAGLLLVTARAVARIVFERRGPFVRGREVLVIGGGNAGELIVREMVKKSSGFSPIGILDDNPAMQGLQLHGVKVRGPIDRLDRLLRETRLDEVVIAMPSASGARRQTVVEVCRAHGVPVRTLPGPKELLGADSLVTRLRDVQVEDLLGRQPVRLDLAEIGSYVAGRAVLVTGAGGSIGSELVRQIGRLGPTSLVLIDNSETNLFTIERELSRPRRRRRRGRAGRRQGLPAHARAARPPRAAGRVPRRGLQARAGDGAEPARGDPQQHPRDPRPGGHRPRGRRRAVRAHLDRQGRQPADRDGRLQGALRVGRRGRRAGRVGHAVHRGAVRQRARRRPAP